MAELHQSTYPGSFNLFSPAAHLNTKETMISEAQTASSLSLDSATPQMSEQSDSENTLEDLPYDVRRLIYLECLAPFVLEARAIHLPKAEREGLPFYQGWQSKLEWQSKTNYMALICTSKWLKFEVENLMWENSILYLSTVNLIHRGLCFAPSVWTHVRCVFIDGSLRKLTHNRDQHH